MTSSRAFSGDPSSVRDARGFAAEALAGSSAAAVLGDVQLMVSELASNVVEHALSGFEVTVLKTDREVGVEVTDHGSGVPAMPVGDVCAPRGRGLRIIDMLSSEWGVRDQSRWGKTVWFTLTLAAPGVAASGRNGAGSVA